VAHALICHGVSREIVPGHFRGILRPWTLCHGGFRGVHRNGVFIVTSESEERRKVEDQTRGARALQGNYNRIPSELAVRQFQTGFQQGNGGRRGLRAVKFKQVALIYGPLLLTLFAVNFVFLRENGSGIMARQYVCALDGNRFRMLSRCCYVCKIQSRKSR